MVPAKDNAVPKPSANGLGHATPGVAPLDLGNLNGEDDARIERKAKIKSSKLGKKTRPHVDENDGFVVLTPRQNEDEPQNSLFRFFTVLRQEYKNDVLTSPRGASRNSSDAEGVVSAAEVVPSKRHFKALRRMKRKATRQVAFVRKVFSKEIKLQWEQVKSRDLSDSVPEITEPEKELVALHHGSSLSRRITAVVKGTMIAIAAHEGKVALYDGESGGNPRIVLYEKATEVYEIAWLGGDVIGTVGNDGFLRTWTAATGKELDNIEVIRSYGTAMVALDTENVLVGTAEGDLIRYSHKSGTNMQQMAHKVNVHDNSEAVYNLKDLNPEPAIDVLSTGPDDVHEYRSVQPSKQEEKENQVLGERRIWKIAAYRNEVVSVSEDRTCVLTHARDFHCYGKWRHKHPVLSVAINSRWVVTGSFDTLRIRPREDNLLDVRVWKGIHQQTWVHSLTLYKTDILISGGGDGNIVMYNLLTEQPIHRIGTCFSAVWDTALLPGKRLAICGPWEKDAYILDLKEFEEDEDNSEEQFSIWKLLSPRSATRSPRSEASGSLVSEDNTFGTT